VTARCPQLSGSLEAFGAGDVLQWFAHRRGDATIEFRPAESAGGGCVVVHVRDGVAQALKLLEDATAVAPTSRFRGIPRPGQGRPPARIQTDLQALEPRAGALGALLLERGVLNPGQLRAGLGVQRLMAPRAGRRALGQVVCDLGFAGAGVVENILREQAQQRLVTLLQVRVGEFAVFSGSPEPPLIALGQRIDHLLLCVAHMIDQAPSALSRG
jgi:hypothetical protein